MRRYVYRRPFDYSRRRFLPAVFVGTMGGAPPAGNAMPMAIHHYKMAGAL